MLPKTLPKRATAGASDGSGLNRKSNVRRITSPPELDIQKAESASASGPGSIKDDGFMEELDPLSSRPAEEDGSFDDPGYSSATTSDFDGHRQSALLSPMSPTSSTGLCSFDVRAFCRTQHEKERKGSKSLTSSLHSIDRATMQIKRRRLETLLKGFKFFQEVEPGVVQQLPNIVEFATYPKGTVIFRQGDPPGNCYIILKGELGILVKDKTTFDDASDGESKEQKQNVEQDPDSSRDNGGEQAEVEGDTEPGSQPLEGNRQSDIADMDSKSFQTRLRLMRKGDMPPPPGIMSKFKQPRDEGPREQTVEGFSFYTSRSELGQQVANLGPGNIVGEIALMQDQPRSASCKCLEDMEMLVIARREFDHILKLEMQRAREEKQQFLHNHLPGVPELPPARPGRGPHASYFFRKEHYSKGHVFFKQDEVSEECIFIVFKGSVEFQRIDYQATPSANRNGRPMSSGALGRAAWAGGRASSNSFGGSFTSGGSSTSTLWASPGSPQRKNLSSPHRVERGKKTEVVRKIGTLLSGGVFGSMPIVGQVEPFNVIAATSPCEVFCTNEVSRLPKRLVESIKEYLTHATSWRLERLRKNRAVEMSQASTKPNNVSCPWGRGGLGLDLLLTGKLHPPPPGLPDERRRRPQSAPAMAQYAEPTQQQIESEQMMRLLSPVRKNPSKAASNSRPASAPNAAGLAELQRARTSRPASAVAAKSQVALNTSFSAPGITLGPKGAGGNAVRQVMLAC